jgi:RNA polymerase primary sigma factor
MGKIEMLSALGENPVEMIDIKSPYQEFYEKERSNVVTDVLKTLTRREHHVICLRYGLENQKEHSLEEVAKIIDKTRERVRQIEMKAIRKLKHPTRSEILDKL